LFDKNELEAVYKHGKIMCSGDERLYVSKDENSNVNRIHKVSEMIPCFYVLKHSCVSRKEGLWKTLLTGNTVSCTLLKSCFSTVQIELRLFFYIVLLEGLYIF